MSRSMRTSACILAIGLAAAACGSSADDVVSESSNAEAASETAAPPATEAAPPAEPVTPPAGDCDATFDPDVQIQAFDSPPPFCLDPDVSYSATVTTNAGTIVIDLDQAAAPTTVNSFVFLARNNYFDDTVCHRIIQEFVVQCGDPTATGTGGPGYSFPDELPEAGQYQVGSIAMANSGPNTNGSQFFIITGANGAGLPPLYNLFGQVEPDGLGVVAEMNARGSLDPSGIPSEELRIESVEIIES